MAFLRPGNSNPSNSNASQLDPQYSSGGNPLTKSEAQWGDQCNASKIFQFLEGKPTSECGRVNRPGEACEKCQQKAPIFMRLEITREVSIEEAQAQNAEMMHALQNQSFFLPDGAKLVVFNSAKQAAGSQWAGTERKHENEYVYTNQSGQKAVCFCVCAHCKCVELKPIGGVDPSNYCKKGQDLKDNNGDEKKQEKNGKKRAGNTIRLGKPKPSRFIFGKDEDKDKDTFPKYVELPPEIITREINGKIQKFNEEQLVVFFDDVIMPFKVINGQIVVEINEKPFAKLYRPKEYDHLAVAVCVYLKGKAPNAGLNLVNKSNSNSNADGKPIPMEVKDSNSADKIEIMYKRTFRFYMSNPLKNDMASDSESDNDEKETPKGVVAKRRYHMNDHLQLNMSFKAQEAFYSVIQGFLKGGFFNGDSKARKEEKSKRNARFTDMMNPNTQIMEHKVAIARQCIGEILVNISKFYIENCSKHSDFREGLIQLIDFSYGLGKFGAETFNTIFSSAAAQAVFSLQTGVVFRFSRQIDGVFKNVLLKVSNKGWSQELEDPQNPAQDAIVAEFTAAFAELTIVEEAKQQPSSSRDSLFNSGSNGDSRGRERDSDDGRARPRKRQKTEGASSNSGIGFDYKQSNMDSDDKLSQIAVEVDSDDKLSQIAAEALAKIESKDDAVSRGNAIEFFLANALSHGKFKNIQKPTHQEIGLMIQLYKKADYGVLTVLLMRKSSVLNHLFATNSKEELANVIRGYGIYINSGFSMKL